MPTDPTGILKATEEKIRKMSELENAVTNAAVRQKIGKIREAAQEILKNLERHPEDIPAARRFLNYYFETTLKIIYKYVEFASIREPSDALQRTMARMESALDPVERVFRKELAHLTENDVIDMEAELDVLQKTIQMDALSEDTHAQ